MSRRHLHLPPPDRRPRRVTAFVFAAAIGAAGVLAARGPAHAEIELISGLKAPPILLASADPVHPAELLRVAGNGDARPRAQYGEITAIEPIIDNAAPSGTGAAVGGVIGAVLGNQVGDGKGRTAATVVGGVSGAVAGNKVEKSRSENVIGYRIHVRLDNGGSRSFERSSLDGLDVGERVRIDGARLRPA